MHPWKIYFTPKSMKCTLLMSKVKRSQSSSYSKCLFLHWNYRKPSAILKTIYNTYLSIGAASYWYIKVTK